MAFSMSQFAELNPLMLLLQPLCWIVS